MDPVLYGGTESSMSPQSAEHSVEEIGDTMKCMYDIYKPHSSFSFLFYSNPYKHEKHRMLHYITFSSSKLGIMLHNNVTIVLY